MALDSINSVKRRLKCRVNQKCLKTLRLNLKLLYGVEIERELLQIP